MKLRVLAGELVHAGVAVEIWAADYGSGRSRVPRGTRPVDGIPVRYFRRVTGYHWSPVVPQAALASIGSAVDVAHCMGMRDGLTHFAALGFRRRGTPYLIETLGMHAPLVRGLTRKRIYDRVLRSYVAGAAGLVATSEREEASLRLATRHQVWLRYNPLQAGDVSEMDNAFRATIGVADGAALIGWVGRISRSKGLPMLVRAVAQLPGAHLALAGPDDADGARRLLDQAIAESAMNRRVHFLGPLWDDAKDRFLSSIDVFALPSLTENFGNAAAEAAAAGLPVVMSDQCGAANLLKTLGAATVVPLDVRNLRDALAVAIRKPRTDAGPATPAAAVRATLSPERVARRQLQIYADVLDRATERIRPS